MSGNARKKLSFIMLILIWIMTINGFNFNEVVADVIVLISLAILSWQLGYFSEFYISNEATDYHEYDRLIRDMKEDIHNLEGLIQDKNIFISSQMRKISGMDCLINTMDFTISNCIKAEKGEDSNTTVFENKLKAYEYFKMFTEMYVGNEDKY